MNMHHDLDDALSLVRVDFAPRHRQPSAAMVIVATLASLIGSLLAEAALVAVGTAIFPSTKGFVHFRFSDYAKLTVIGVVVACVAWPIVTRMSSAPRGSISGWPWWSPWSSWCRMCGSSCTGSRPRPSPSSWPCTWPLPWSPTTAWCASPGSETCARRTCDDIGVMMISGPA